MVFIFAMWRYASAAYAVVVVVCLTRQYCVKTANVGSRKQRHPIAQEL